MPELKEVIIKELEQWEVDIHEAESVQRVEELRKRAEAHIHGGHEAQYLNDNEAEAWRGKIRQAVTFRLASLGWTGE